MSHISTVECEFRNLDHIRAACAALGWTFHENQSIFRWYGRWVGDTELNPECLTQAERDQLALLTSPYERKEFLTNTFGRCDHAITVPHCSYQIGIRKIGSKFVPVYDSFEAGGLDQVMPSDTNNKNPLAQAYALEAAKYQAYLEGWSVSQLQLENGTIQLNLYK